MPPHSGSILRQLQTGFGLAVLGVACLLGLFMDRALEHFLDTEDAQVMAGQAQALTRLLAAGQAPSEAQAPALLEKAEWEVLDAAGRTLAQSPGMRALPALAWPRPGQAPRALRGPSGGTYSVQVLTWSRPGPGASQGTLRVAMDRTHEEVLLAQFRRTVLLGVLLSTLLAALLGRAIAAWGLRPLDRIIRESSDISGRNLELRLDDRQFPRELAELVATLNAALERLQGAFERLDSFGAELAHELRTPLQTLRSTLENLALDPACPDRQRAALGGLLEECDGMAALIEQMFFLARSDDPGAGLTRQAIRLETLLEEVRTFFEPAAENAGVSLEVDPGAGGALTGDPALLARGLHNLVANALRHTPAGGKVRLGGAPAPGARLWVEDTGAGIAPEWLPKLGKPFLRGPDSATHGGHGLGLAIVARIAAMHGGTLTLTSDPGQGTRAELTLI